MKNEEFETLLKGSPTLTPSPELRERVLARAAVARTAGVRTAENSRPRSVWRPTMYAVAVAVAMFFVVFGGLRVFAWYNDPYASVFIDINPSVELVVSRAERIVGIDFLNSDAERVLSDLPLRGKSAEQGLELIMECLADAGYFDDRELVISVVSDADDGGLDMLERLCCKAEQVKACHGYRVNIEEYACSSSEHESASEHHLSPAKYALIERILASESGSSYSYDELTRMSMHELHEILRSQSSD